jgi:hypothetical protein
VCSALSPAGSSSRPTPCGASSGTGTTANG